MTDQHGNVTFTDNPSSPLCPATTFPSLCPSKAHRWKRNDRGGGGYCATVARRPSGTAVGEWRD
ncbi:hypothetical protein [Vreelandella titanicae]|uniref:hypothetical protein n=1 Tax=Vreelandella titanicae TaxID=664683 RepID=UPI0039BF14EA